MKKLEVGARVIGAVFAVAVAVTLIVIDMQPPRFEMAPQLEAAIERSALQAKFKAADITAYQLFCDAKTSRVGASFMAENSRLGAMRVVGETPCKTEGVLAQRVWREGIIATAQYDPDLFVNELSSLYAKTKDTSDPTRLDNVARGRVLHQDFYELAHKRGIANVLFMCDEAGQKFGALATYQTAETRTRRETVNVRCEKDAQAFRVRILSPTAGDAENTGSTEFEHLNDVAPALAEKAYQEFLAKPELRLAF